MKDTQKRFLGAVLAASSVVGIVAPSVTAMATVQEDEEKATAEELRAAIKEYTGKLEQNPIFANYHRVEYAADRLAKYDAVEAEAAKQAIIKYADKVYTTEVKTILDKMGEFASSKSMATYDELVNKDIKAMENKEDSQYLMGRLTVWGTDFIFAADTNYSKATDAIIAVGKLVNAGKYEEAGKLVPAAKEAIKNIKTYEVNGAYLEAQLKEYEDIIAEKANLKVVSAEAINAKEIKVVFNREVDEDSAEAMSNYTVYTKNDTTKITSFEEEGCLQDDNKTVILPIKEDGQILENGQTYKVEVKNVVDTNGKTVKAYKGDFVIFNDNTAPALVDTDFYGSTVKLTFDEPLKKGQRPTIKIDDKKVSADDLTFSDSKDAGEYELTVALDHQDKAQELGKHVVKISGAKDYADNTADMITTEYTATEENQKPSVKSIKAEAEDQIKIEFNTNVKTLVGKNLEIKKGNHQFTISDSDIEEKEKDEYVVTIKGTDTNELYEDDETSVDLNVKLKNFEGTNNKQGDTVTKNVTLEKDEEAPIIKGEATNRVQENNLVLVFNEDLIEGEVSDANLKKINVVRDGNKEYVKSAEVKDNQLKIVLKNGSTEKTEKTLETGTYKITLEKGVVEDKAYNKNEALTTSLVYTNDDSEAFHLGADAITLSKDKAKNRNKIEIDFGKEMDEDSATDPDNYSINGVNGDFIPAFTDSSKTKVEILLPRGTVSEDDTMPTITLSKDLKTKTGMYLANSKDKEYVFSDNNKEDDKITMVTGYLDDDTDPTMTDVELVKKDSKSNTTETNVLRVTFSEDVDIKGNAKNDFIVKDVDGNRISVKYACMDDEDKDTMLLRLETPVKVKQGVTVEVTDKVKDNADGISITDTRDCKENDHGHSLVNSLETASEKKFTKTDVSSDQYKNANEGFDNAIKDAEEALEDAKKEVTKTNQAVVDAKAEAGKADQAVIDAKAVKVDKVLVDAKDEADQAVIDAQEEVKNATEDERVAAENKLSAAKDKAKIADQAVLEAQGKLDAAVKTAEENAKKVAEDVKTAEANAKTATEKVTKAQEELDNLN